MTTAHHDKLDGIAAGAQVNVATDLGRSTSTTQVTITSSTGNNTTIGEASGSAAGVMSVAHHDKLDGIASGATNVTNNNQLTNGAGYIHLLPIYLELQQTIGIQTLLLELFLAEILLPLEQSLQT